MSNLSEEEKKILKFLEISTKINVSKITLPKEDIKIILDLYTKEKEKNKELNLENQALYESINCNDNNMLAREYQKLQKGNEELKKYKELKKIPVEILPKETDMILMYKRDFDRNFGNDYVSKDKIKDKIKELEEEVEEGYLADENVRVNKAIIEVLKELLEENK